MGCLRGKANPEASTKLHLFTDSAGYCQNPNCNDQLFPEGFKGHPHIAEMAHIFAAIDGGPRTKEVLSKEERGAYENLILLCATCHTLVDKAPMEHPASLIQAWKRNHLEKIKATFGVKKFDERQDLRQEIQRLLRENKSVHELVGPDLEYRFNPEASEADLWKLRTKYTIIPNSNKILLFLDSNEHLLNCDEKETAEKFRFHVKGLILRHLDGQSGPNAKFPVEMNNVGL